MEFPTFFYLVSLLLVIAIHNSEGVTESEAFTQFFNTATRYMANKQRQQYFKELNKEYQAGDLSAANLAQTLWVAVQSILLQRSTTLQLAIGTLVRHIEEINSRRNRAIEEMNSSRNAEEIDLTRYTEEMNSNRLSLWYSVSTDESGSPCTTEVSATFGNLC